MSNFKLGGRFKKNQSLLDNLMLIKSDYVSKNNLIRVEDESIKLRIHKKKIIEYRDSELNCYKLEAGYQLVMQFKKEEVVF